VDLSESRARALDAEDVEHSRRGDFLIPPAEGGHHREAAYLAGNSLGLQAREIRERLDEVLREWHSWAVEGHTEAQRPWVSYHELLREPAATLVGALPSEVVSMNSLTVNLHLMMISFYRPTPERHAIVVEDTTFPSDSYAVRSQAAFHGFDPDTAVVRLEPRTGESGLRSEDVVAFLEREGHRVALVLLGAVNYYSGEHLDMESITKAGRAAGAVVGWDLAHAAGNVPLRLHDWGVDWAAWCTYKYLNSGPGSIAGAFVHERHLAHRSLPKLAGWWSTDPDTPPERTVRRRVAAGSGLDLSLLAPPDPGLDELVELAVEDRARVARLLLSAQILDHLVGVQDVRAHLVAPRTGGVLLEAGHLGLLLLALALEQPRLEHPHGRGLVLQL